MLKSPDSASDVCRHGTDPGTAGRALNEGRPGAQRTGQPMKLGSNKFDIPTVRPVLHFWGRQQCLGSHAEIMYHSQPWIPQQSMDSHKVPWCNCISVRSTR